MGDMELSLALMIPTYLQRRGELDYLQESSKDRTFLQEALDVLFTECYNAYNGLVYAFGL